MQSGKMSPFLKIMLFLGLAFLYIPLVVLVVYSFNSSQLVTVWGGFSTQWYGKLLHNNQILSAAWLSLKIAVVSSLAAVALGTMAGYALSRIKRFRGNTLFAGMVSAPMVMPDVITGLSMLLIAPAIASGFLLGITLSLDDFVITSFLSGPGSSTLPQVIFSKVRLGLKPEMNVLATIMIAIVGTLVLVMNYFMMRQVTKREREMQAAYQAEANAVATSST